MLPIPTNARAWGRRTLALLIVSVAGLVLLSSCSEQGYALGDSGPGGGVVFYVSDTSFPCGTDLSSRCHHLEAAGVAGEALRAWAEPAHVDSETPDALRTAIGAGWANTIAIIEQGNTDPNLSAAAYADAYEQNRYDDWYLPSKDEIFELYEQHYLVDASVQANYWTSSGYDFNTVWNQSFVEGPQHRRLKFDQVTVRPIRAF